jgi:hypothetical protein
MLEMIGDWWWVIPLFIVVLSLEVLFVKLLMVLRPIGKKSDYDHKAKGDRSSL